MANDIEDDGRDEGGEHNAQQLSLDHNKRLKILKVDLFHSNSEKIIPFPFLSFLFYVLGIN